MRAWVEHVDGVAEGVLGRDDADVIGMVEKSLWAAGDTLVVANTPFCFTGGIAPVDVGVDLLGGENLSLLFCGWVSLQPGQHTLTKLRRTADRKAITDLLEIICGDF